MTKKNPSKRKSRKRVSRALTAYVRGELRKRKNPRVKLPSVWTKAEIRVNDKGEPQIRLNPGALGKTGKFAKCVKAVELQGSAYDPRAVCAAAERRKYGKKKFQALVIAGRKRAARKRK